MPPKGAQAKRQVAVFSSGPTEFGRVFNLWVVHWGGEQPYETAFASLGKVGVEILLCGQRVPFVVDTGAELSLLNRVTYDGRPARRPSLHSLEVALVDVQVLNVGDEDVVFEPGELLAHLEVVRVVRRLGTCEFGESSPLPDSSGLPAHMRVMFETIDSGLSRRERCEVSSLLQEYAGLFTAPGEQLGHTEMVKHRIDTGAYYPTKQAPRRCPLARQEILNVEVDKMLASGTVRPSSSPWASPVVLVTKKDGSTRFCIDYRKLNDVTRKDAYPLPRIDDTLDSLDGTSWFSTLDFTSGYWQVEMDPEDAAKTAFGTRRGFYEVSVMPFGLCNAPAIFQRLMECVLRGLLWTECLVYIDDIIIFGKTFDRAISNLCGVFYRIADADMKLKPSKCTFFQRSAAFLGHIVSGDGIWCDPKKLQAVESWSHPHNVADVRSFLGFANYYRRFIPDFATLAEPLVELTKKNMPFRWGETCEEAFSGLRLLLTLSPVLAYPRLDAEFILDTDASATGIGGVLSQFQSGTERWSMQQIRQWQREDGAISAVLKVLAAGGVRPAVAELSSSSPEGKAYWALWDELEVHERVLYLRQALDCRPSSDVSCMVVPPVMRWELFEIMHGGRIGGHFGITKSLARIRQRFTWPGIRQDVLRWVRECDLCSRRKPGHRRNAPLCQRISTAPWERMAIDFMGPLPETSSGIKYILVACDYFTKWTEAFALPDMTAQTTADCLVSELFLCFGVPRQLHSDQGRNFESGLFTEVCLLLGIEKTRTTPYHSQSDGLVERFNRTLQDMLSKVVNERRDDWDTILPYVLAAYRGTTQECTGVSPNLMMVGREVGMPIDLMFDPPLGSADEVCPIEFVEWIKRAIREAHAFAQTHLGRAAQRQKRGYDSKVRTSTFAPGQWVGYFYPPADVKLGLPWPGPYLVLRGKGNARWIQASPDSVVRVVAVDNLKVYEGVNAPVSWLEDEAVGVDAGVGGESGSPGDVVGQSAVDMRGTDS
ncbi:PREDICTED: uncharacterized protein K02A2.6-like [Priapulus caudatus]|uniref:RNA-directed DNA polymerase n=1 Tax=Priapulus caudatus TaxID=37621 RepID=A0ABM1EZJ5_PRICU|nr:PREDICTED: uncharacterized protein K02A2.6-like [Priapulus caudatus]